MLSFMKQWPTNKLEVGILRAALIATSFGNGITGVVLAIQVVKTYRDIGVTAALLSLSIGMLLSFASGGIRADGANRIKAIVVSDLVRGFANIAIVLALFSNSHLALLLLIGGCFTNGLCAGYFRPALASLWASLIPAPDLKKALSTTSLLNRLALASGGALGGVLIGFDKGTVGIFIDAISFFLAAAVASTVKEPQRLAPDPTTCETDFVELSRLRKACDRLNVLAQWRTLFDAARESSWFNLWVKSNITYSFLSGITGVCLPLVLVEHYSNREIGLFNSISVIALLIGAILARTIVRLPLPGLFTACSTAGNCLAGALISLGAASPLATGSRFIGYTCSSLSAPSLSHYVAQDFAEDQRGKVYSMQTGASSVLAPFGMVVTSLLLVWLPAHALLLVSGILGSIVALIPLSRKAAWHFSLTAPKDAPSADGGDSPH